MRNHNPNPAIILTRLLSFALICSCSCSPCRNIESAKSDSLRVEILERRVVIHDTIEIEIPRLSERQTILQDTSTLSNALAHSTAIIQPDGALFHSLETYPQKIAHPTTNSVVVRDSIIYHERIVRQVIEVERELTRWQSMQIMGFWTLAAAILALTYLKVSI